MRNRPTARIVHVLVLLIAAAVSGRAAAQVTLPGTQPEEKDIEFAKVSQCVLCHAKTENGAADPYFSWQGGMMAQAARDPVYRAALAIANQDVPGVGEFCNRCHAPRGWLEGRSKPADASALTREDLHGVSCDVCHRFVDPLSAEAEKLVARQPARLRERDDGRRPRERRPRPVRRREGRQAPRRREVGLPRLERALRDVPQRLQSPPGEGRLHPAPRTPTGHIERTYSEWLLSDFAKKESLETCQSCHYPKVPGGGVASKYGGDRRDHFVVHGPPGGSTWVQEAT